MALIPNIITILVTFGIVYGVTKSQDKTVIVSLLLVYILIGLSAVQYFGLVGNVNNLDDISDSRNLDLIRTVCLYQDTESSCLQRVEDKKNELSFDMISLVIMSLVILFVFAFSVFYLG